MYKVVIVDDEPIIAEGLRRTVDWNRFGCEVTGIAYSGKEGLDGREGILDEQEDSAVG